MIRKTIFILFSFLLLSSCHKGRLNRIGSFPLSLKESSAAEKVIGSPLIWTIEDSRNPTVLFGVNEDGNIEREIKVINATNNDWEDLTSDASGDIYIGDFGNNRKDRDSFIIYKISNFKNIKQHAIAELIIFNLPPDVGVLNFESFFIYKKHFYLINKKKKNTMLFKVPNRIGNHTAEYVCSFNLESENQKITSADISKDGKTIVLLNSNMLWKITDFNTGDFCNATIESIALNHFSQKEGVCFKDENTVYITDERVWFIGGNIYSINISD